MYFVIYCFIVIFLLGMRLESHIRDHFCIRGQNCHNDTIQLHTCTNIYIYTEDLLDKFKLLREKKKNERIT